MQTTCIRTNASGLIVGFLWQRGVRMIIYLDDILILQDSALLAGLISQICQLLEALGFLINRKKSLMNPTQQIEFLGFQLCSQTLRIHTSPEKLRKTRQEASHLFQQTTVLIRDLARFIGKTSASVRAIQVAPLHYRALQRLMNVDLSPSVEKFNTRVQLSPEAKADLMW